MTMPFHFSRYTPPEPPEPKKDAGDRLFDFASRPAKSLTRGQKMLQGLLLIVMIGAFFAIFSVGSWLISASYWYAIEAVFNYWWVALPVVVVVLLATSQKSKG